jgi:hypothetical protein
VIKYRSTLNQRFANMIESSMKSGLEQYQELFSEPHEWQRHIIKALHAQGLRQLDSTVDDPMDATASSVLLVLAPQSPTRDAAPELSLILTKRSRQVRQAGDLCCPGGTVQPLLDRVLARMLFFPQSPLSRWPFWPALRSLEPAQARQLARIFATGLRESWEEMRLNPVLVSFLGILPEQHLVLFPRVIYPLVVWVERQKRFFPSWEVDRIVSIPVRELLNPLNYCRYRLYTAPHLVDRFQREAQDYPCVVHREQQRTEILWGVTYRMVTELLELVFGFSPPDVSNHPFVPGLLDESYINGRARA